MALLIATAATAACVLLFMLWIEPNRVVAKITRRDGTVVKLTTRAFQRRLEVERIRSINLQKTEAGRANRLPGDLFVPDYGPLGTRSFAAGVIDRMTREEILEEEAGRRGLSVTTDEIDLVLARACGLVVWPKEIPAPVDSSASAWLEAKPELREQVRALRTEAQTRLERDGLPRDYREIVRLEVLEGKLKAAFFAEVPLEQDRVALKLVRFETNAEAQAAAAAFARSQDRDTFDRLYTRVMRGEVSGASGMVRAWSSRAELERDYNRQFSQDVMALSAGEVMPQPVFAARGWYLVEVEAREIRTMPEAWRRQRGIDAMQSWLAQQNSRIVQDPDWMNHIPPLPQRARDGYAGEFPPPVSGPSLTAKPNAPGLPSLSGKASFGVKPNARRGSHDDIPQSHRRARTEADHSPERPVSPL